MAIIYRHRKLGTQEVFYIGIGESIKRAYCKKNRNKWWYRIVEKYDYDVDIIFENISRKEAIDGEILLIKLYGRRDLKTGTLVNLTNGGEGVVGNIVSDETKEKLRQINLGKKQTKETIEKRVSKTIGRKHSEESKIKMSETQSKIIKTEEQLEFLRRVNIGRKLTNEHKIKIGESLIGRKHSEETKIKMSNNNFMKGKKRTEEEKKSHSEKMKGKMVGGDHPNSKIVLNIETGIFYMCLRDSFDTINNISYKHLSRMLNGNRKNKTNLIYC